MTQKFMQLILPPPELVGLSLPGGAAAGCVPVSPHPLSMIGVKKFQTMECFALAAAASILLQRQSVPHCSVATEEEDIYRFFSTKAFS